MIDLLTRKIKIIDKSTKELNKRPVSQETLEILKKESENLGLQLVQKEQELDKHKLSLTYCIVSSPGTGKTSITKIFSGLMSSLGIISDPSPLDKCHTEENRKQSYTKTIQDLNIYNKCFVGLFTQTQLIKSLERLLDTEYMKTQVEQHSQLQTIKSHLTKNLETLSNMNTKEYRQIRTHLPSLYLNLTQIDEYLSKDNPKKDTYKKTVEKNIHTIVDASAKNMELFVDEFDRYVKTVIQNSSPSSNSKSSKHVSKTCDDSDDECSVSSYTSSFIDKKFGVYSREDFVAGYVGQTAIKTTKLLTKHLGGSLIIDEAYSLIHDEKDSFGMEALTTINRFISENIGNIAIFFAGYEDKMEALFRAQPGLRRRIHKTYRIENYNHEQLYQIFILQCKDRNISIKYDVLEHVKEYFKNNYKEYKYFGGDTFMLAQSCSILLDIEFFLDGKKELDIELFTRAVERFKQSKPKKQDEEAGVEKMWMYM
jgi:hypothetical protein